MGAGVGGSPLLAAADGVSGGGPGRRGGGGACRPRRRRCQTWRPWPCQTWARRRRRVRRGGGGTGEEGPHAPRSDERHRARAAVRLSLAVSFFLFLLFFLPLL
ncbi:hypothetical protein BU14_0107s0023 [Porphyra umbilicalis]|uniref:Uncharacterized protein n=1 Tax=Porphyra umbilicalis TaxID=2786 RepID=A0A1X6PCR8_PORUM|nr:hypothetical protein BU14_0107s0023 [Porphyra umbilicalis]|eukprot:OSX78515.1 hypothetical protein BU14_0107s0023 [Porphyra umbilicalis]